MELTSPTTGADLVHHLHQESFSEEHASACREVFETLSAIDVSEHIEEKNDLSYLSWAWAYITMMEKYPTFNYCFHPQIEHSDETVTVHCTIWVIHKGQLISKYMWLPVMNYANKAIISPNSVDINKNKMRCLTKAIAMLGLGAYIYAGEDLPKSGPTSETNRNSKVSEEESKPKKVTKKTAKKKKEKDDTPQEPVKLVELKAGQRIEISDEESADEIADLLIKFASTFTKESALLDFYRKNQQVFDYFDTNWNDHYVKIQAKFSGLRKKLKEEGK